MRGAFDLLDSADKLEYVLGFAMHAPSRFLKFLY